MAYADYTYYTVTYKGTMPEMDYNRLSRQASAYIDQITFNRAPGAAGGPWAGKIKDACCALSEVLLEQEQGGEVTAQSVGPWSKQFAGSGQTAEQKKLAAVAMYLGLTGLLYQGGR